MRRRWLSAAATTGVALMAAASGQTPPALLRIDVGISARTGIAPLVLAQGAGIFERHRLDVVLHPLADKDLGFALQNGGVACGAAAAESWIVWNANGLAAAQIFAIDRSAGADALVARPGIGKIADLKGRTIAAGPIGSSNYFQLAWVLAKNGAAIGDVHVLNLDDEPADNAFASGAASLDAVLAGEPFLSQLRDRPELGNALASTGDSWSVTEPFGCAARFLAANPGAGRALAESFFEALELIRREPQKSFATMGAAVRQSAEQFEASQRSVRWQDRAANRRWLARDHAAFAKEAGDLLLAIGAIKQAPDPARLIDARFVP